MEFVCVLKNKERKREIFSILRFDIVDLILASMRIWFKISNSIETHGIFFLYVDSISYDADLSLSFVHVFDL